MLQVENLCVRYGALTVLDGVNLTLCEHEWLMLAGKNGKAKQLALKGIIKYAEILGASELVEVTKTHMCCGSEAVPADFPDGDLNKPEYLKQDFYDQQIKEFRP